MKELGIDINFDIINEQLEQAQTVLILTNKKEILAIYSISDEIKESSYKAIKDLKSLGKQIVMMTGDNSKVASYVAKALEIDIVYSEIMPEDKGNIVNELQSKSNIVTMVGDGINDAIALTKSDIGIAIGAGTDVAISSSNIVLMKNSLEDVVKACKISEQTIKNIKLSLFWAFFYNILCIPIACGILYPFFEISLNPMIASLAMSLSSVSVVLNAIRLNKKC
jgi:Cu+-exporting ATPase